MRLPDVKKALQQPSALMARVVNKTTDIAVWAMDNQSHAAMLAGVIIAVAMLLTFITSPDRADGLPIIPIIAAGAILYGAGTAIDTAADSIEEGLAHGVQAQLSSISALVESTIKGDTLSAPFDALLGDANVVSTLYDIHHTVFVPIGSVVAAIFFVLALVKLVSKAGQTDGGIDVWQLVMCFVIYALTTAIVQASWEIMGAIFALVQSIIGNIDPSTQIGAEYTDPTEGVGDLGCLLVMLITSTIGYFIALAITGLTTVVIFVRGIQIYLYTVTAPIPLAFMASEGGREMTKSFMKRYLAVLLTGVVMAMVYIMFASMAGSLLTMPDITVEDPGSLGLWLASFGFGFVGYVAFGWAILHSGQWAKDLVGV